jgi:transposase-like protein
VAASCSVCALPERQAVDEALVSGTPYRDIARQHEVSRLTISALSRHRKAHLSPALVAVQAEKVRAGALSSAERVEGLYARAERVLEAAEEGGQGGLALASIRELRGIVELLCRLSGELDERPQVQVLNVQTSPEWLTLRSTLLSVLDRHPAARADVLAALSQQKALTA